MSKVQNPISNNFQPATTFSQLQDQAIHRPTISADHANMSDFSDCEMSPVREDYTKVPGVAMNEDYTTVPGMACVGDLSAESTLDDSSIDILDIDFAIVCKKAMKEAMREINASKEAEKVPDTRADVITIPDTGTSVDMLTDDLEITKCVLLNTSTPDVSTSDCVLLDDSDLLEIDKENKRTTRSRGRKGGGGVPPVTKVTKAKKDSSCSKGAAMKKRLETLSKQISINNAVYDQHNRSEISFVSDEDDEDLNREIRLRIKWGADTLRIPIRQLQPFSEVYRILGEQHKVSPSRILLSYNDTLIQPTLCPHDLGITVADFIEGGIIAEEEAEPAKKTNRNSQASSNSNPIPADAIALKVQSADRKATVIFHLAKRDKMKILMLRYAEVQKAKLESLKFMFDGEALDPSDTPISLDLDGGECIDVYHR